MSSVSSTTSSSKLAIDGLVSGLDTSSLIDSLISAEGQQQSLLATKQSTAESLSTALKSLNTKVSSLKESAEAAAKPASWTATKATSTATSVTATSTNATASAVTFNVTAVAASQSSLSSLPADLGASPTFTLTGSDGTTTSVSAASSSIADVLDALNGAGTGVKASAINVGTSANPSYKLQLTGTETGAGKAFTVSYSAADGSTKALDLTQIRAASDATLTLFPGTAAEQTITQGSNTFAGLMSGVDVTVTKVEADPVTVSVAADTASYTTLAKNLVSNLNLVLGEITSQTATKQSTASDGGTLVKGGVLSGDSAVRSLQESLLSAGSSSFGSSSLASIGLTMDRSGTFALDEAVFSTAYAKDPDGVQALLSGLGTQVGAVAESASNSSTGTLTQEIKSQDQIVDDLGDRISDWDDRLALRRAALEKMYSALEVSLSNMQSQSSWLSSQLAGLTSS